MWQVQIHKLVMEEDFKRINKHDQLIILKTINKKLSVDPEGYGEGLKQGLKGFWKLKISHYRVIYRVEKEKVLVFVLKVGLRRDQEVYKEMLSRLSKL
jgi:mRNA interferase RelE/StbE